MLKKRLGNTVPEVEYFNNDLQIPEYLIEKYTNPVLFDESTMEANDTLELNKNFDVTTHYLEHAELCSDLYITAIEGKNNGKLPDKSKIKRLGGGVQGSVFLITKGNEKKILKRFNKKSDLLFEINAVKGLSFHPTPNLEYNFEDLTEGNGAAASNSTLFYMKRFIFQEYTGDFCAKFSFIEGRELRRLGYFTFELQINKKKLLRIAMWILRQIQAVHFSLNAYAITDPIQESILDVQSYANFHGDIHGLNIMIRNHASDQLDALLIDYGAQLTLFFENEDDIRIHVYNKYLRKESGIKEENVVLKNRLLNFGQNLDFCMTALLVMEYLTGYFRTNIPFMICRDFRSYISRVNRENEYEKHFQIYLREFYRYFRIEPDLLPIIEILLKSTQQPYNYQGWIHLKYNYYNMPVNQRIGNNISSRFMSENIFRLISEKVENMLDTHDSPVNLDNHINTGNLILSDICHPRMLSSDRKYVIKELPDGTTVAEVGSGVQGVVYFLKKGNNKKILKMFEMKSALLLEANGIRALQLNPIPRLDYELHEMITSPRIVPKLIYENFNIIGKTPAHKYRYHESQGVFCAEFSVVGGVEFDDFHNFIPTFKHNVKMALRMVIWLLKQVQALHFSFNSIAMTQPIDRSSFDIHSFTNYHGDIHRKNILFRNISENNYETFEPILIDYGGLFSYFFQDLEDVKIFFYDKFIRQEYVENPAANLVLRERILNFGQNMDLCLIQLFVLELIGGYKRKSLAFKICYFLRKKLKNDKEKQMKHMNSFFLLEPAVSRISPILKLLLLSSQQTTTYTSWLNITNLLKPD
ncbi:hypothetical protein SNEBB_002769 [Seison nebaliae]|nr:hypothetical protein SNEBB_002769 [Seison nebaliae]